MHYTYDLHAISTSDGKLNIIPFGLQVLISIITKKVLIGFYRRPCQVLLKYLCKVETIHFQEILFFFVGHEIPHLCDCTYSR